MNLYNNLKNKVYLGLILALVSIPAPVLSETWDQNLDLTIPSLEMPSTLGLDSKDKLAIMMGFECCWAQRHIEAVQTEHLLKSTEYWSKVNPKKLLSTLQPAREPAHWSNWALFTTLQLLDVYTTDRGMKYNCIKELNPLLPEVPEIYEIVALKTIILVPTYTTIHRAVAITDADLFFPNLLTASVVINNYNVLKSAKRNCQIR